MKTIAAILVMSIPCFGIAQLTVIEQGRALYDRGDYQEAIAVLTEPGENEIAGEEALYLLGKSEYQLQHFERASDYLERAIKTGGSESDYYMWLGLSYKARIQDAGHFEKGILSGKALDNYRKAVKIDPENIQARIYLANYYIHAPSIAGGSIKKAKEQVDVISTYDTGQGTALMAGIYMKEENYDLAVREYERLLLLEPDNTGARYQLGMIYQGIEQFDEAMNMFESAVRIDGNAYGSLYQIGRTACFSGEYLDRGIRCLTDYIAHDPGPPYPGLDAAHWRLGMLYEKQANLLLAAQEYEKASGMKPDEEKYQDALEKVMKLLN